MQLDGEGMLLPGQEIAYFQGMPAGGAEEDTLRESHLTNIVLDDFRKQVSNLEQQVGRQSTSALDDKHPTVVNNSETGGVQLQHPETMTTGTPLDGGANPLL